MEIIWHGYSYFEIEGKENGNRITVAINPFDKSIGLRPKKVRPDILLISSRKHTFALENTVIGESFLINEPGEYEVKGVKIKGTPSCLKDEQEKSGISNTIFIIDIEGIKICHMGYFFEKGLSETGLENIIKTQILLIPVGGSEVISGKDAAKIVERFDPKIVVPAHYRTSGLKINLDDEKTFLKAMGIKRIEKLKRLKIKKSDLEKKEGREIVVLENI